MSKVKVVIDDGCNSELLENAFFDGHLEIPKLKKPKEIIIPKGLIPFSQREKSRDFSEFVVFYEHDVNFGDILREPQRFVEDIRRFQGMMTVDCSLYRDMPLAAQIINTYRNRTIGHYFQTQGIYVVPSVRWSDDRSYTDWYLPEKFAFLGVPKESIVSIGTYGCVRGKENRSYFQAGLEAMLDELRPKVVVVYGPDSDEIFAPYRHKAEFYHFPDWISSKRKPVA